MKHTIRQRVINQYGLPVTKVETVNGELGSGIFDRNGKEIFEGDIVKVGIEEIRRKNDNVGLEEFEHNTPTDNVTEVVYQFGEFVLMWDVSGCGTTWVSLPEFGMFKDRCVYLEVIGHVDD